MKRYFKISFAVFFTVIAIGVISWLFWEQELKYALPTPVPKNYELVYVNERVIIDDNKSADLQKPIFYHFFNTDCPCSKFNLRHFNWLKSKYEDQLDFVVVVPEGSDLDKAKDHFRGETKILEDKNKEFAIRSGVYSTPQAVIINTNHTLYYRGNYNKARYCTDPKSNFAQMALDSLLFDKPAPDFGPLASIAYGCGLDEKNILTELTIWN